jgi:predicted nucleotidyltransferase
MLLKEIVNEDYIARKAERHLKSVIDKNETNEISQRLIAKGIDPTPENIKLYLQLFSESA